MLPFAGATFSTPPCWPPAACCFSALPPFRLLGADDWTGNGGVGDYANSNGNTQEVIEAGHQIRDRVVETRRDAIDTGEVFDCVVVGGGISGLAAALCFQREG